jgi:hypothetical protein
MSEEATNHESLKSSYSFKDKLYRSVFEVPDPIFLFPLHSDRLRKIESAYYNDYPVHLEIQKAIKGVQQQFTKQEMTPEVYTLLCSQARGLNYLYGTRCHTKSEDISKNPITDILITLATPQAKSLFPGKHYAFAIRSKPEQRERLSKENKDKKLEQYSYTENALGEKQVFRTLSRFKDYQKTVARGLFLVAAMNKQHPELLESALQEFVSVATANEGDIAGTAIGVLEMLFNMELLQDDRFKDLGTSLRNIALKNEGSYKQLSKDYQYKVVGYSPYWVAGETELRHKEGVVKDNDSIGQSNKKELPQDNQWATYFRERKQALKEIEHLTLYRTLEKNIPKQLSLTKLSQEVKQAMKKKSELKVFVQTNDTYHQRGLKRLWKSWLLSNTQPYNADSRESQRLELAVRSIFGHFLAESALSQKTKFNLDRKNGSIYELKHDNLITNPLYTWALSLRDDAFFDSLIQGAKTSPLVIDRFLRLVAFEAAQEFYITKEYDFLYNPAQAQRADSESLIRLMQKLRSIVMHKQSEIKQDFLAIISEEEAKTRDLITRKRIKGVNDNLDALTFKHPTFSVGDKSKKLSRRDFLKLSAAAIAGGTALSQLPSATRWGLSLFAENPGNTGDEKISGKQEVSDTIRRTPDRVTRDQIEKITPFFYAMIIHAPKNISELKDGAGVSFFPTKIYSQDEEHWTYKLIYEKFTSTIEVDNITSPKTEFTGNQLVIQRKVTDQMHPPDGWKIVSVIQQRGFAIPYITSLGSVEYMYDYEKKIPPPKDILFVFEPLDGKDFIPVDTRIKQTGGSIVGSINFYLLDGKEAMAVNAQLSGDPVLQKLHKDFIAEVSRTNAADREALSDVATKYSKAFSEYTDSLRYYALGFPETSASGYDALIKIASNPDTGYYCTTAAQAYRQFMRSGGFTVLDDQGANLYKYGNQLWGRTGHVKNILILPNRKALYIDMTPGFTDKTPRGDIDALRMMDPPADEMEGTKENLSIIEYIALKYGLSVGIVGTSLYSIYRLYGKIRHEDALRYVDQLYSATKTFSPEEQVILLAVTNQLACLPYNNSFYDEANATLQLLNNFSEKKHLVQIQALFIKYLNVLQTENVESAYMLLSQEKEKKPEDFIKLFPEFGREEYRAEDFPIIYKFASLLWKNKIGSMKKEIEQTLNIPNRLEEIRREASEKSKDILELTREWLYTDKRKEQYKVNQQNVPYFRAIIQGLESYKNPEDK